MRKLLATLLTMAMVISLAACGSSGSSSSEKTAESAPSAAESDAAETAPAAEAPAASGGSTVYVLGPTPDHGWTSQAGLYAQQKAEEINSAGTYKGVFYGANNAEEQTDQIAQVIANGDAAGVVIFAMDVGAATGERQLYEAGIPFVAFDRIIEETEDFAILNYSGDNFQAGAGIAKFLQNAGMNPGDTLVTLYGDTGIVCNDRETGFRQFLMGDLDYYDEEEDKTYHTSEVWTKDQLDDAFNGYSAICDWAQDPAYEYMSQQMDAIVASAKKTGELYIFSCDDEMTFGVLNLLEGNEVSDATKADLESLNIAISAIGGMQELYDVMNGKSSQSGIADQYFDDMCSVYFSPKMMNSAIEYMLDYLNGNWDFEMGDHAYENVFLVTRDNAASIEGFTGH